MADEMQTRQQMLETINDEDECPSCYGLNTSCPDGCGRDENGELDGSRLTNKDK